MRVDYNEMKSSIKQALINKGVKEEQAEIMAEIHSESSLKGVNSHGLNRIPRLIDFIEKSWINVDGEFELIKSVGAIENYDGNLGFGVTNASKAAERAAELVAEHGIGMVSLRNTTHWMRGGAYVEMIADKGLIGMAWTNTESIMPVWGSDQVSTGNNPICIGIPSDTGNIILDMALSQYSFGKIESTKLAGENLPFPGGYDKDGKPTVVPKDIEEANRVLPMGYWKGSGLAIALDTMAALLANGQSGADMDEKESWNCTGASQVFIAMNPLAFASKEENEKTIEKIKSKVNQANPIDKNSKPRYPGQGMNNRMEVNKKEGIKVDKEIWEEVKRLSIGN